MAIPRFIRCATSLVALSLLAGCQQQRGLEPDASTTETPAPLQIAARTEMRISCTDEPSVRNVFGRKMEFLVKPNNPQIVQYTVRVVYGSNSARVLSVPASGLQPSPYNQGAYLVVDLDEVPSAIWSDLGGATFIVEGWTNSAGTGTPASSETFLPSRFRGAYLGSKTMPYSCRRYDDGLFPGEFLQSPNGQYRLWAQNDGNVVLYRDASAKWTSPSVAVWRTLYKRLRGPATLVMQEDGNLVSYDKSVATWATMRFGSARSLGVQDDGNLVVSDCSAFYTCTPVWNRFTNSGTEF